MSPPPRTKIRSTSATARAAASAFSTSVARITPSGMARWRCRLTTTLSRPGSGRQRSGMVSQVLRPITTALRVPGTAVSDVILLRCERSAGSFQGIPPAAPIPSPRSAATTASNSTGPSSFMVFPSHRHIELDEGMMPVSLEDDVLEADLVDRHAGRQAQAGQRERLARQLHLQPLDVVEIDVGVAQHMDEVSRLEPDLARDHVGQERVAGDVERHPERHVGRPLIELAVEPRALHVEL